MLLLMWFLTCYQISFLKLSQQTTELWSLFVVLSVMIGWICHFTKALPKQAALLRS